MRYSPIFILSKGRADCCTTADLLITAKLDFKIAVESEEAEAYASRYGRECLLVLPFNNLKQGATPARNFIKDYARDCGAAFHWCIDDNIKQFLRYNCGKGRQCSVAEALSTVENFVDCYENIAIAGLKNSAYAFSAQEPFRTNQMAYQCVLIRNSTPYRYRGLCDDADYSLQVLSGGWCSVVFSIFTVVKNCGKTKGGCSDTIYADNGREKRAVQLQEFWPDLEIKIRTRYGRCFQDTNLVWRRFKTKLVEKSVHDAFTMPYFTPRLTEKDRLQPCLFTN